MASAEWTWSLPRSDPDGGAYLYNFPSWRLSKPKQICLEKVNNIVVLVHFYTNCGNSLRENTPFEGHNRVGSRTHPPSYAKGVFDTLDPSIPHLGTLLTDGVDSDNRLRWSEVCWAACLMAGRLRDKEYRKHKIVPVSIC